MKNSFLYLLPLAAGLTLIGCKKDSETPTPTKTDMLTAKTWRITDVKLAGQTIFNSPLIDACEKDDLYKFNTNKSLTYDQSTLKCDPTEPATRNGSWEFTTNETKLKATDPDGTVKEGTITTLTSTSLVVTEPDYSGSGLSGEVTYTAQ